MNATPLKATETEGHIDSFSVTRQPICPVAGNRPSSPVHLMRPSHNEKWQKRVDFNWTVNGRRNRAELN